MDRNLIIAFSILLLVVIVGGVSIKTWKDKQEPILGYRPKFFNMRA